jgi:hypothetical protein
MVGCSDFSFVDVVILQCRKQRENIDIMEIASKMAIGHVTESAVNSYNFFQKDLRYLSAVESSRMLR